MGQTLPHLSSPRRPRMRLLRLWPANRCRHTHNFRPLPSLRARPNLQIKCCGSVSPWFGWAGSESISLVRRSALRVRCAPCGNPTNSQTRPEGLPTFGQGWAGTSLRPSLTAFSEEHALLPAVCSVYPYRRSAGHTPAFDRLARQIWQSKLNRNFGDISRRSIAPLLMERLPQFDFVAIGIIYPGEAAVAFVLALRVDAHAFFR